MQVKNLIEAFEKNLTMLNVLGGQATTYFKALEGILKVYKSETNITPKIMEEIQEAYRKKLQELAENSKIKLPLIDIFAETKRAAEHFSHGID